MRARVHTRTHTYAYTYIYRHTHRNLCLKMSKAAESSATEASPQRLSLSLGDARPAARSRRRPKHLETIGSFVSCEKGDLVHQNAPGRTLDSFIYALATLCATVA